MIVKKSWWVYIGHHRISSYAMNMICSYFNEGKWIKTEKEMYHLIHNRLPELSKLSTKTKSMTTANIATLETFCHEYHRRHSEDEHAKANREKVNKQIAKTLGDLGSWRDQVAGKLFIQLRLSGIDDTEAWTRAYRSVDMSISIREEIARETITGGKK